MLYIMSMKIHAHKFDLLDCVVSMYEHVYCVMSIVTDINFYSHNQVLTHKFNNWVQVKPYLK